MMQRLLRAFAADKDSPRFDMAPDIVADLFTGFEIDVLIAGIVLNMSFPAAIETFETSLQPGHARFHETDAEIGILVEQAIKNYSCERHHLAERMAEAVDRRIGRQIIHAQTFMRAAVHSDAAAETIGLGIDRPIFLAAQMTLEAGRRQHHAAETQLGHRAAHFLHGFFGFLERDQPQSLETRALFQISIREPIIPGARYIDGELEGDDFAEGQTAGAVKHGTLNADVFHELQPAVLPDLAEGTGHELKQTGRVQMIQRRKDSTLETAALDVGLRHVLQQRVPILHHVTVAVDDGNFVASHNPILPSLNYQFSTLYRRTAVPSNEQECDRNIDPAIHLTLKLSRSTVRRDSSKDSWENSNVTSESHRRPRGLGAWPRARNHIDGAGFQGRRNGAEAIAAYGNDPANPASRSGDNRRKLKTKRSEVIEVLKASIEGLEYTLNEREDNSGIISK